MHHVCRDHHPPLAYYKMHMDAICISPLMSPCAPYEMRSLHPPRITYLASPNHCAYKPRHSYMNLGFQRSPRVCCGFSMPTERRRTLHVRRTDVEKGRYCKKIGDRTEISWVEPWGMRVRPVSAEGSEPREITVWSEVLRRYSGAKKSLMSM